jgi:drug/metabolite transporter (DMT)-like permease
MWRFAVFAFLLFREDLNAWRIAGIAFICVGTVLIARSRLRRRDRRHRLPFRTDRSS